MKKLIGALFLFGFITFSQNVFAQENESLIGQGTENVNFVHFYDSELFTWNFNMFGGLTLNYQNQNSGISFGINQSMRNALLEFSDSAQAYNSYRAKNITGNVFMFGGLALVFSTFIPLLNIMDVNISEDDILKNARIAYGLSISGLVSTLIGSFIFSSGQENLFNSVNMFNRNKVRELK